MSLRPPAPTPARLRAPACWAVGLAAALLLLHVRDPHGAGSYGFCPWLALTGTFCPGCGGLRAVYDLSHADLAGAVSSNLLVVALVPVAVFLWGGWTWGRWRGRRFVPPVAVQTGLWSLLVVVPVFALLRNLEPTSWLAP